MTDTSVDPWLLDGLKAQRGGYKYDDCPHPAGSAEADTWRQSWSRGEALDRELVARTFWREFS